MSRHRVFCSGDINDKFEITPPHPHHDFLFFSSGSLDWNSLLSKWMIRLVMMRMILSKFLLWDICAFWWCARYAHPFLFLFVPHSFTTSAMALVRNAFEDIYLAIRDADGTDWANLLRFKMHEDDPDGILKAQFTSLSRVTNATNVSLASPTPASAKITATTATPQLWKLRVACIGALCHPVAGRFLLGIEFESLEFVE